MFKYIFKSMPVINSYNISRANLVRIIDESLADSGVNEELQNNIVRLARTITKVDFNTWKCDNSCGCPLTLAGVVNIDNQSDKAGQNYLPTTLGAKFYGEFDIRMRKHLRADSGASTATVID